MYVIYVNTLPVQILSNLARWAARINEMKGKGYEVRKGSQVQLEFLVQNRQARQNADWHSKPGLLTNGLQEVLSEALTGVHHRHLHGNRRRQTRHELRRHRGSSHPGRSTDRRRSRSSHPIRRDRIPNRTGYKTGRLR